MEPRPAPGPEPPDEPIGEVPAAPRQRWRLVLARSRDAPRLVGRELSEAWDAALAGCGLPLYRPAGRPRASIAFGAPLAGEMAAEAELADIVLTEAVAIWTVREALEGRLPEGWRLIDVADVWLGAPALAGRVAAADYRIEVLAVGGSPVAAASVRAAAAALLAAPELPRERLKGTATVRYDLRPLLADVRVGDPGPPVVVLVRTRFDPVLGTGRPEEVVAALGERVGIPLEIGSIVRERLVLAEDLV